MELSVQGAVEVGAAEPDPDWVLVAVAAEPVEVPVIVLSVQGAVEVAVPVEAVPEEVALVEVA